MRVEDENRRREWKWERGNKREREIIRDVRDNESERWE